MLISSSLSLTFRFFRPHLIVKSTVTSKNTGSCISRNYYTHNIKLLSPDVTLRSEKRFIWNPTGSDWRMVTSKPKAKIPPGKQSKETLTTSSKSLKSNSTLKSLNSNCKMKVIPIKALQDNYMYLLVDETTRQAAAVDPVNASAMADMVSEQSVDLKCILTTHHHYDHANGNTEMVNMFPDLIVYGGDTRVQAITRQICHRDVIKLGSLNIECLSTPCHTKGHICYYVTSDTDAANPESSGFISSEKVVFTGDTLFIAGCGRFFEGSSEQMDHNLNVILSDLPADTKVYCGHEYTVTNLKFALSVEPQNQDIKSKLAWAQNKIAKREPTVPSTIGEEKKLNPFMRLKKAQVKKYTGETDELEVMTVLRHRKNEFQP